MRVLVSAASRYGATAEIAVRIGEVLGRGGADGVRLDVEVRPIDRVGAVDRYDAAVLGSALYLERWLPAARNLCLSRAGALSGRPVWLFSSGPIGVPPRPNHEPYDLPELMAATRARDHRIFAGRLDRSRLHLADRALAVALRAPEGDFRDWDAIEAWAAGIAGALRTRPAAALT